MTSVNPIQEAASQAEEARFKRAYQAAEAYIRQHEGTFHFVSMFLPPDRRVAMRVAFAFFRKADDLVDNNRASLAEFQAWRAQAMRPLSDQTDPILIAWADVRLRFGIEPRYVNDLLDGIERDAVPQRFNSLRELGDYCYHVAGTVGLLSLPLLHLAPGVTFDQAAPHALELCTALQLTNILRDVNDDLAAGRIYLPADELAAFELTFADIEARTYDQRFQALMQHLTLIARQMYVEAWPQLKLLSRTGRFVAGGGAIYYQAVLDELERRNFNVFAGRIHFSKARKLWIILTKWPMLFWPTALRPD